MPRIPLPPNLLKKPYQDRRPPRAAYALPTIFTAGNVLLGFLAIMKSFEGARLVWNGATGAVEPWTTAAAMIGAAVFLDGLDGRIARMTNTVSDFGREMDSLADVITFGLAPAVLGVTWGILFALPPPEFDTDQFLRLGYFVGFLYLLCGASRLARFNVTTNPVPKNPGRPDRKYFVGLPIPAAAGMVSSVVYALNGVPVRSWMFAVVWMCLLALLSFLMVSTWRYRSFKDLNLTRPHSSLVFVLIGSLIYLIWHFSQPFLLILCSVYVTSGILIRLGGIMRRRFRTHPQPAPRLG